jgi:hypothetical protein
MWQLGSEPDPTRPLRSEPVRRDEVLVDKSSWTILTMPLDTWTRERRSDGYWTEQWLVGDPVLWRSVIEELAAEHEAAVARHEALRALAKGWGIARWLPLPPEAEAYFAGAIVRVYGAWEYTCQHCGVGYLGCYGRPRLYVCSDRCKREREKTLKRQWRAANPPDSQQKNAIRMKRRAAARAGRVCEHCGTPIAAARSTKRFCSDICRVRHSRPPVALQ